MLAPQFETLSGYALLILQYPDMRKHNYTPNPLRLLLTPDSVLSASGLQNSEDKSFVRYFAGLHTRTGTASTI